MSSKSKLNPFMVKKFSEMFSRIQEEQSRKFKKGDRVRLVDYKFLSFGNEEIAAILKDANDPRPLRYEQQLHHPIFEINPQVTLVQFLCGGEEGVVLGISLIDSTWVGEFCSLSYSSEEEAEAATRKIGTVKISIGLAKEKGTVLEGRNISIEVSISQIEKIE